MESSHRRSGSRGRQPKKIWAPARVKYYRTKGIERARDNASKCFFILQQALGSRIASRPLRNIKLSQITAGMMYRPEDLDGKKGLIEAFFEDEYSYAELVAIVVDQFFLRLSMFMRSGNQIISSPEITDIFANLDEILVVSQEILSLYQNDINLEDIQAPQRLAGLMMPWIPKLECYCTFVTNLCRAYKVLDSLLESNPKFKNEFCDPRRNM